MFIYQINQDSIYDLSSCEKKEQADVMNPTAKPKMMPSTQL